MPCRSSQPDNPRRPHAPNRHPCPWCSSWQRSGGLGRRKCRASLGAPPCTPLSVRREPTDGGGQVSENGPSSRTRREVPNRFRVFQQSLGQAMHAELPFAQSAIRARRESRQSAKSRQTEGSLNRFASSSLGRQLPLPGCCKKRNG